MNGTASCIVSALRGIGGEGMDELRDIRNGIAGILSRPRHSISGITRRGMRRSGRLVPFMRPNHLNRDTNTTKRSVDHLGGVNGSLWKVGTSNSSRQAFASVWNQDLCGAKGTMYSQVAIPTQHQEPLYIFFTFDSFD